MQNFCKKFFNTHFRTLLLFIFNFFDKSHLFSSLCFQFFRFLVICTVSEKMLFVSARHHENVHNPLIGYLDACAGQTAWGMRVIITWKRSRTSARKLEDALSAKLWAGAGSYQRVIGARHAAIRCCIVDDHHSKNDNRSTAHHSLTNIFVCFSASEWPATRTREISPRSTHSV